MSKNFFAGSQIETVDLGDGFWIKVRTNLSVNDMERLSENGEGLRDIAQGIREGKTEASLEAIISMIDSWNLTDENGQIPPVNVESLRKLPVAILTLVSDCMRKASFFQERSSTSSEEISSNPEQPLNT